MEEIGRIVPGDLIVWNDGKNREIYLVLEIRQHSLRACVVFPYRMLGAFTYRTAALMSDMLTGYAQIDACE